jgi:hypothetical protein
MTRRKKRFPPKILDALVREKILGLRAGRKPHRFIGIWMVVVENRLFVRSWFIKPRSWYFTFLDDSHGTIHIGNRKIFVRAVHTRSQRIKKAIDRAYAEKYDTPAALKFVQGFRQKKRRETTTELVPV